MSCGKNTRMCARGGFESGRPSAVAVCTRSSRKSLKDPLQGGTSWVDRRALDSRCKYALNPPRPLRFSPPAAQAGVPQFAGARANSSGLRRRPAFTIPRAAQGASLTFRLQLPAPRRAWAAGRANATHRVGHCSLERLDSRHSWRWRRRLAGAAINAAGRYSKRHQLFFFA